MSLTFFMSLSSFSVYSEVTPRIKVAQYYNDNVSLAPEGMEEDAYISEIQPGIDFIHNGRRIDVQANYNMQALYFSGNRDKDEVYHNAFARTEVNLVPQTVFVDASMTYSQQFISLDGAIDLDNLSSSENSTDVLTYRLSPYVRQRFGNFANAEYRIEQREVKYEHSAAVTDADSSTTASSIDISNGLAFDELNWHFLLSHTTLKAENTEDSILQNVELSTNYRLSPKFELIANFGYEDNDYEYTGNEDPSGEYWSGGFGWSPGRRTQFRITHGRRFFGETSSLLLSHRTRRSTWNAEYSEQLTTNSQLETASSGIEAEGEAGEGGIVGPDLPRVRTSSVVIVERASISSSFQTGKTTLNFNVYDELRNYQDLDQDEETIGGSVSWNWRFLPRTTSRLSGEKYRIKYLGSDRVDHIGQIELTIDRQVRRTVTASIGYRVLDRNSTDNASEYERNLAFVSVGMEF